MSHETYGHTPLDAMFDRRDVYDIGYNSSTAAREPVRLGIIGAGGIAQAKYLPAIQRLRTLWEPARVEAVTTLDPQQGRKLADLYGCVWYDDHRRMLAEQHLDGVLVTSPDAFHHEHTMAALECGSHVLVEKPFADSLSHAEEMCRAAEDAHRVLMTVANKRFSPPYLRAKRLLSEAAQPPVLFQGKFNLGYRYVALLEGGTVHLFDIARYLMGDVTEVHALGVNRYGQDRGRYPLDNAAITLAFASGAVGSIITSGSALSLAPWERVEVYADGMWLAIEDQHRLIVYSGEESGGQEWAPTIPNTLLFDEEFGGYQGLVQNFIQAIRGIERPLCTGWDGYRALELVIAVHLAIARHATLSLPLDVAEADAAYHAWLFPALTGLGG